MGQSPSAERSFKSGDLLGVTFNDNFFLKAITDYYDKKTQDYNQECSVL
jgi:hypothetical protein